MCARIVVSFYSRAKKVKHSSIPLFDRNDNFLAYVLLK